MKHQESAVNSKSSIKSSVNHESESESEKATFSLKFSGKSSTKSSINYETESEQENNFSLQVPIDDLEEVSYLIPDNDTKRSPRFEISPRAAIAQTIQHISDSLSPRKSSKSQKERNLKDNQSPRFQALSPLAAYEIINDNNDVIHTRYGKSIDEESDGAFPIVVKFTAESMCMRSIKKYSNRCTLILIGFLLSIFVTFTVLLTVIPCDTLEVFRMLGPLDYFIVEVSNQTPSNETFSIVLFGDSLVNKPFLEFDLGGKIQALLPQHNLQIKNCGFNGATIFELRNNVGYMTDCVLSQTNTAVILFWDSDCSNVDESTMTNIEVQELRKYYIGNVSLVIETIQDTGALLALAGPGLLGETGQGLGPSKYKFVNNQIMLDAYTLMNQKVSMSYNIPYINVRFPFQNMIPAYQCSFSGNPYIEIYTYTQIRSFPS